jgi:hypothetical protein
MSNNQKRREIETFADLVEDGLCPTPDLDPARKPLPATLRGIPVTFASMIMTDGKTIHIGIYRGLMVGGVGNRYINPQASTTVHIATEVVKGGDYIATVNRLSAEHATTDWPAVDWKK